MTPSIKRREKRAQPQTLPQPVQGQPGLVQVDATWGTIQPMQVADGVGTVGELEVMKHLEQGQPLVDDRTGDSSERSTLPDARNIPYPDMTAHADELDREQPTIFF